MSPHHSGLTVIYILVTAPTGVKIDKKPITMKFWPFSEKKIHEASYDALVQLSEKAPVPVPIPIPKPGSSIMSKLVSPMLLLIGFGLALWVVFFILRVVKGISVSFVQTLGKKNVNLSRQGLNIKMTAVPQQDYIDACQRRIYSAWMNSSAPGFKSRYWGLRNEKPQRHRERLRRRFKRWREGGYASSSSSTSSSTDTEGDDE
ncbi:hypothetical protein V1514DRAFT_325398 [Lipomyces japonicus]|uniref:uncharacterized protein n=1 Tax=Lipomyces japonicus TaxID=56871 RepID=UPI0034CFF381